MIDICPKCKQKFDREKGREIQVNPIMLDVVCPACATLKYIPEEPNQMKEKNFV